MQFVSLFQQINAQKEVTVAKGGMGTAVQFALACMQKGQNVVLVMPSNAVLTETKALATLFTPEWSVADPSLSIPSWELPWISLPTQPISGKGHCQWVHQMAQMYALQQHTVAKGILVTVDSLCLRLPPTNFFDTFSFTLTAKEEFDPEMLIEQAVEWGYVRVPSVLQCGDIARRGDIVDIFPSGYERPVRIEFFGDIIEDMRLFDSGTQRSLCSLKAITLLPVSPNLFSTKNLQVAEQYWDSLVQQKRITEDCRDNLIYAANKDVATLLPGMWHEKTVCLAEWLPKDVLWILPSKADMREAFEASTQHWGAHLHTVAEAHDIDMPAHFSVCSESQVCVWEDKPRVIFDAMKMGTALFEDDGQKTAVVELPERSFSAFRELFTQSGDEDRPWQRLVTALRQWSSNKRQVILSFSHERSRKKFLQLAEQDGIRPLLRYDSSSAGMYALISPFRSGRELVWSDVLILGEDVLQPKQKNAVRAATGAFKGLDRYDELELGDFLVHRDYGIGRYAGLHHISLNGTVANDFLLLEYAGDDKLYVPADRLSCIQRFKGADSCEPALDRLGSAGWGMGKEKARKAIEKIAEDLIEMYAWRKVVKGFSYEPIGELYREFEASFGFEETPDQARAIEEVLQDMDKPEPMDRLVCGDVGFGKTEVALRAAFRAATEGRQVALLCPTTILAEQHYQTFRSRLAKYPLNVGLLSRFVSRAQQKETLESAKKGHLDILIGTHRVLSDDVVLPNLGLLILDEEQRFGVRHKEKLKQFKKNVDALTLTATPIPRTLQLSMSGIRDLSVIETAPPERKPVATALIERDPKTLRDIVERELARNGQVFWVHNRVQGLEEVVGFVKNLVPAARVGMVHGQLNEKILEETMRKFWHGELDVLVCTAIVESGLDFPQANTLIVDKPQLFGLGQLYQLRGRVGRSDRQAYAVFVSKNVAALPPKVQQRLRIILELDYLGAGFQVAMEDLRMRGAGNILGESQSGHMTRLGLDLFLEMLENAVNTLKGKPLEEVVETELTIGFAAHIPASYMTDARQRLRYYKALSSAANAELRHDIEIEIKDQFGALPLELVQFLAVLSLKEVLKKMQVLRADIQPAKVRLFFAEKQNIIPPEKIFDFVATQKEMVRLLPPATLELSAPKKDMTIQEWLLCVKEALQKLL